MAKMVRMALRPLADRIWEQINKKGPMPTRRDLQEPCWSWGGKPSSNGYGRITVKIPPGGRLALYAHRVTYEMVVGPIPDGTELDHLCRNRMCVNPAHLEPVTHAENLRRGSGRGGTLRTACPQGHRYDKFSLFTSDGHRYCGECNRLRVNAHRRAAYVPRPPAAHCAHGHAYTEENTTYLTRGGRRCRTCHREKERARQRANAKRTKDGA